MLRPDSRGRMALNAVVDRERNYIVERDERGVVTLTPAAIVLSDEQFDDLRRDPEGFVALIDSADRHIAGVGETVSIDEMFTTLD